MAEDRIIWAQGLVKDFSIKGKQQVVHALSQLSFQVRPGQLTALIGPDGAGKTTLMRLICGLMSPTQGKLQVLGRDTQLQAQEIQDRISYMPQKFGLYEDLTIQENMDLYADLHGVPAEIRQERFKRLLDMTGLAPFTKRQAGKLSGGMKQKLGLACTLVRSPELLLLDEPTVGVDPLSRRELWEILQQLVKDDGLSVFVSTAYMDEAELCKDVLVMHKGRLLLQTTPEKLRSMAEGRCFQVQPPDGMLTRILQTALLLDKEHIVDAVPEGGRVRGILGEGVTDIPLLEELNCSMEKVPARLEDSFMILLHQAAAAEKAADKGTEEKQVMAVSPEELIAMAADNKRATSEVDIEVKNLVRKFGDFTAVANTSFQVHRGEVFGLLGPNGAGKTTTFRMLCGLLPATSGQLEVAGVNLRTARTQARANIGYVAQKFSLYGDLTVRENLEFFGGVYGLARHRLAERMEEIMEQFQLHARDNTNAKDLPGGYKQRLSMAVALLHGPKILFLDEPTSGIDPLARRDFWRQITLLAAGGTTIIVTTHFMEEAEYCDRIMIQDQGKLLAIGTPREIRQQSGSGQYQSMNEVFINIVERARAAKQEIGKEGA